jgi:hypothetical protein
VRFALRRTPDPHLIGLLAPPILLRPHVAAKRARAMGDDLLDRCVRVTTDPQPVLDSSAGDRGLEQRRGSNATPPSKHQTQDKKQPEDTNQPPEPKRCRLSTSLAAGF